MPLKTRRSPTQILTRLATAPDPDLTPARLQAECDRRERARQELPEALRLAIAQSDMPPADLIPGFAFNPEDMEGLLLAFFYGARNGWLSNLHRLDASDRLPGARGIVYDRDTLEYGNPLLRRFTHHQLQVAWTAIEQISTSRAGMGRTGWLAYCLKVLVRKLDETHPDNAEWPEVRQIDIYRGMVALSQQLAGLEGNLDGYAPADQTQARLKQLFCKLKSKKRG
jgi:hypothetical protein